MPTLYSCDTMLIKYALMKLYHTVILQSLTLEMLKLDKKKCKTKINNCRLIKAEQLKRSLIKAEQRTLGNL